MISLILLYEAAFLYVDGTYAECSSYVPGNVFNAQIPFLERRKWNLREVKYCIQNHTAHEQWNHRCPAPKPHCLLEMDFPSSAFLDGLFSKLGFHSPNCLFLKCHAVLCWLFSSLLYVFIGYKVFYELQIMLVWSLCFECNLHSVAQSLLNITEGPTEGI